MRLAETADNDSASALSVSYDSNASPPQDGPLNSSVIGVTGPAASTSASGLRSSSNGFAVTNGNGAAFDGRSSPAANGTAMHLKQIMNLDHPRGTGSAVARVNLPGSRLFEESYIDREEFVRLVIQSLRDVGYVESAATLEAESGYRMESPEVTHFRRCVLGGMWSDAEACLPSLGVEDEESLRMARFLICQQKYLELLEIQSVNAALNVLRNELAPLNQNVDELHSLSGLIMCSNAEDLKRRAKWDGAEGKSRRELLTNLQRFILPSVMLPQRRFAGLIEQAFTHQRIQCMYHNAPYAPETFSLYSDHHCSREAFPLLTTNILKEHSDEVWNIEWSHDGQYLASASKDKTAFIWHIGPEIEPNVRECSLEKRLRDHQDPVGCLAWSPNDSLLLTSCEFTIKMWNTKTGVCVREMITHNETISALEWLPDGSGFVSGGMDRKIILWDAEGVHEDLWIKTSVRVTDLAIAPDLSRMVVVGLENLPTTSKSAVSLHDAQAAGIAQQSTVLNTKENRLIIYDFNSRMQEASIRLDGELTSVKISQDSRYALINHAPDEVQLWDLETARLARKFTGQRQGEHVIRSCFGGVDGNFIVSGSEDGNVYVWHRDTGVLLEVLDGHGVGSVNAVIWNPKNERMFASCSDDATVRIWESPHAELLEGGERSSSSSQLAEQNGKGKGKLREGLGWLGPSGSSSSFFSGASSEVTD